ncbi:hypothetical protein P8452_61253 [Trifolium repens]|nr:hypothetical protein P8452_61253 [Trifolium repens]
MGNFYPLFFPLPPPPPGSGSGKGQRKDLTSKFAHPLAGWVGERNESFTLGKHFAVAKLTASLSPRAKLRPRLLVTSGRLFPSPEIQVSTGKDLLIPRGRLGSKLPVAYLTPFLIISKIGCPFPLSLRRRSHSVNRKGKPTHPSAPLVDRCGFTKRLSTFHSR